MTSNRERGRRQSARQRRGRQARSGEPDQSGQTPREPSSQDSSGSSRSGGGKRSGGGGIGKFFERFGLSGGAAWAVGGIVLIGGIIAFAALARGGGSGGAQLGDHWHTPLSIRVCGDPFNVPSYRVDRGMHSHGDGVIHIEPNRAGESGGNASLENFFGGVADNVPGFRLAETSIQLPGDPVYENGDLCPDGSIGTLHALVNGSEIEDFLDYLPQDRDDIEIIFG